MSDAAETRFSDAPCRWPREDMLAWCEDNNMRAFSREMERWYFVEAIKLPSGWTHEIKTLDGIDATAARKLIRGELQDYAGWPEAKMDRYRAWLRSCIKRGMTDARYAQIFQGGML